MTLSISYSELHTLNNKLLGINPKGKVHENEWMQALLCDDATEKNIVCESSQRNADRGNGRKGKKGEKSYSHGEIERKRERKRERERERERE